MNQSRLPVFILTALTLLAPLLSGCGDANRKKITGIWEIETASSLASRLDNEGSSDQAELPDEAEEPRMQIEFRSSGELLTTTRMGSIDRSKTGTWELVSYDAANSRAVLKCTLEMQETETEVHIIDDETIEMIPPNMAGLNIKSKFKRADPR